MKHPQILILGYSEAGMLLQQPGATDVGAVISIHGQREHAVASEHVPHRLILHFDDTEAPNAADPIQTARIQLRQRDTKESGIAPSPPTIQHAKAVLKFAHAIADLDATLLCQCQGGISRSSAAALLCLAAWTGPGHELDCVERILAIRPSAVPHRDLIAFGDRLLDREGKLVMALCRERPY